MLTILKRHLKELVENTGTIRAAAFADYDGHALASYPDSAQAEMEHCAIYGGIALRRLSAAERLALRSPVKALTMQGPEGAFATHAVAHRYQLVVTMDGCYAGREHQQTLEQAALELCAVVDAEPQNAVR